MLQNFLGEDLCDGGLSLGSCKAHPALVKQDQCKSAFLKFFSSLSLGKTFLRYFTPLFYTCTNISKWLRQIIFMLMSIQPHQNITCFPPVYGVKFQLRKFASLPLDYMGIYKYVMGKLPNMHKYFKFWLLCKLYSVLDNLKQEKHGVTTH